MLTVVPSVLLYILFLRYETFLSPFFLSFPSFFVDAVKSGISYITRYEGEEIETRVRSGESQLSSRIFIPTWWK